MFIEKSCGFCEDCQKHFLRIKKTKTNFALVEKQNNFNFFAETKFHRKNFPKNYSAKNRKAGSKATQSLSFNYSKLSLMRNNIFISLSIIYSQQQILAHVLICCCSIDFKLYDGEVSLLLRRLPSLLKLLERKILSNFIEFFIMELEQCISNKIELYWFMK